MKRFKLLFTNHAKKNLVDCLNVHLSGCHSVLDVGCGRCSPLMDVKRIGYSVGVDGFRPSLLASKKAKLHDDYVLADVNNLCFEPRSFQAVVLLDVLEHLSKTDGYNLLRYMNDLTKEKIVVFTPNGYLKQGMFEGNELQKHLSGWTVFELRQLGFTVNGLNGLRLFRKEKGNVRIEFQFYIKIAELSQIFAHEVPLAAFQLFAVKDLTMPN